MSSFGERASQALRFDELEGRFDPWLLCIALALVGMGVVMVASSSMPYAMSNGASPFYYVTRHVIFLGLGSILALMLMRTEMRRIEARSQVLLLLCFVLLLAVFVPGVGRTVNGAKRWLDLRLSNFQAVEAVKLMLIIWLSSYLVRHRDAIGDSWRALMKPLLVAGALVGLLLVQPDFGSAMLILAVTGGLVWLGGARIRNLAIPAVAGLALMSMIVMLEPYRVRRLVSFSDPWADALDSGYQLVQALIAIGRGEFNGVGLGGSILKLDYLPEAHTDFIFAVIAEELGFIGVCAVIAMFALFTWRAIHIGMRCMELRQPFNGYVAFGIGLWISLQAFVSMGVNLGILPTKGLTLPLISSGGSSVLMTCAAFGMLLRVSCELDRAERRHAARVRGDGGRVEPNFDESLDAPRHEPATGRMPECREGQDARERRLAVTRGARARVEPRFGAQR